MSRGKPFQCEIFVSSWVEEKLAQKHNIEIWEIEEIVYDDPNAFSKKYRDCYFLYGQTFSGRYLLVLARILNEQEVIELGYSQNMNLLKIITSRDMNKKQRREYLRKEGVKK